MRVFLHRLLGRLVKRSNLLDESDWERLCFFDSVMEEWLSIPEFMPKTELRAKALKEAKSMIDVERDRWKKEKTDVVARNLFGETFNPFIDQGRQYFRFVAKELLQHPSFQSDLVIGMACFDCNLMFVLPKTQAVDCYRHIFQRFSSRSWLARELRNMHMDDYVEIWTISDLFIRKS